MTLPVGEQNCGNCYFVRTMARERARPGAIGGSTPTTALACCLPVPGTMANPPSVQNPWREVLASYWCGAWRDEPAASTAPVVNVNLVPPNTPVYGTATVDFGSVPTFDAIVAVTFQTGIPANAHVRAWIQDDPIAAELVTLTPTAVVAGQGFTIYAASLSAMVIGTVPVHWSWNA